MPLAWNGFDRQQGNLKNLNGAFSTFFSGLASVLSYILIQYINPSIAQIKGERTWWTEAIAPPLGMDYPFKCACGLLRNECFASLGGPRGSVRLGARDLGRHPAKENRADPHLEFVASRGFNGLCGYFAKIIWNV